MGICDGRVVIITGAGRGLGRAHALAFAAEGAKVVVTDVGASLQGDGNDMSPAQEVVDLIRANGGEAITNGDDIADWDGAGRLVQSAIETFGGLDTVVTNAGIVRDRTLMNMTPDEFDEVIAVNLRGTWSVSRHAARAMKATGGHLLQIFSNSGFTGSIGQTNYAASKAGVMGMLYAWDVELSRFNSRTNALWPIAETDMTQVVFDMAKKRSEETGKPVPSAADLGFGTPETIAPLVVYLCSDRASHLRSQLFTFNGRKLALWSHPKETWIERKESWTLDELDAAMRNSEEKVYVVPM